MECFLECILECFGELFAECCGYAAEELTEHKKLRAFFRVTGILLVFAVIILAVLGIAACADGSYKESAIFASVSGGILLLLIACGITAHVRKKRRLRALRAATETQDNAYRECVRCDENGVSVTPETATEREEERHE